MSTPTVVIVGTAPGASAAVGAGAASSAVSRAPTDFERLIGKSRSKNDLERLMQKSRASSDFQRLMQQQYRPRDIPEVRIESSRPGKFSRATRALSRAAKLPKLGAISLVSFANDMALGILNWNKRNFSTPSSRQTPLPRVFRDGDYSPTIEAQPNAYPIDEVTIVGRRLQNNPASDGQASRSGRPNESRNRAPGRGAPANRASGRRASGLGRNSISDILTSLQQQGLGSPLTQPQPKTQAQLRLPDEGKQTCVRTREKRPACPARGYKLICNSWSKKPCR